MLELPKLLQLDDEAMVLTTLYPGLIEEWPQWTAKQKTRLTYAVLEQADALDAFEAIADARSARGIAEPLPIRLELDPDHAGAH